MPSPGHTAENKAAGIALMSAGVLSMIGLDVAVRWLLQTYTVPQSVFLRCLFSVLIIAVVTVAQGRARDLRMVRPGWHALRSVLMAGSMFAFFHALRFIPLADIMTLAFAAPLMVTALSKPLLGEDVGPWRWSAVIAGFIGVLVVLRPGASVIDPAALYALAGAALYALLSLSARKLSRTESTVSLSIFLFPVPMAIGALFSIEGWITPGPVDWLLFFLCGLFGGLAFILMNAALRRAPPALLVPFEYTGLIWAAIAGYIVWDEVPQSNIWLGAAIIIASGLFILYRETITHRGGGSTDFPLQEAVAVKMDEEA